MGGDLGPEEVVRGVIRAANDRPDSVCFLIVGDESVINAEVTRHRSVPHNIAVRILVDQPAKDHPYDDVADLIGSVTGLPADLSEGTGARFAEIVQEKAGRRR